MNFDTPLYKQDLVLSRNLFYVFNGKKKRTSCAIQELNQYHWASCLTEEINPKWEFMLWREHV